MIWFDFFKPYLVIYCTHFLQVQLYSSVCTIYILQWGKSSPKLETSCFCHKLNKFKIKSWKLNHMYGIQFPVYIFESMWLMSVSYAGNYAAVQRYWLFYLQNKIKKQFFNCSMFWLKRGSKAHRIASMQPFLLQYRCPPLPT